MRVSWRRTAGLTAAGALILALLPATGAAASMPRSAVPEATPTPAVSAPPTPTEPAPAEPAPTEPALPETPAASPTPTPTPTPDPDAEEHEEHTDGPTLPLTRELYEEDRMSARALTSPSAQPIFRLPFAPGQRWGASGSHSDSDGIHRGAIDFAPLSSADKRVLSVAAGRVYRVSCATGWFLGVDHGGGWLSEYYHLTKAQSGLIGKWVEAGTPLGTAGQTLPCGGTPGSTPHVHLSILNTATTVPAGKRQYVPVNGITFDRYTLRDSSAAYDGVWYDAQGRAVLTSRGITCCLTASSAPPTAAWNPALPDLDGNGIDDYSEAVPWDTDLNADGIPDIVAFGSKAYVAMGTGRGFGTVRGTSADMGTAQGWVRERHPRMVADVTGDGLPDAVGFAGSGVYVARGTGSGFEAGTRWSSGFGINTAAGGWRVGLHQRLIADVTGDGRADVVAFGESGVRVARSTGTGFGPSEGWLSTMGSRPSAGGWVESVNPRTVADVDGDGFLDAVGFARDGVYVARGNGRSFAAPTRWVRGFGAGDGWKVAEHSRSLIDVTGDGRLDVVGFANDGVYVAVNTGSSFRAPVRWSSAFGSAASAGGWRPASNPRTLADVNGDGRADVIGYGAKGVYVALSSGNGFGAPVRWTADFASSSWLPARYPRAMVDVDGDGRADVVGFGSAGVQVARSDGSRFGAPGLWLPSMGYAAGGWRVESHPRGISTPG